MLGLKLATDPRWVRLTEISLEEILTDHAYCEQKAASTCISLIMLYPEREELVEKVSPIVTEEWGHFREVLALMKNRGLKLGKQRKDNYVGELLKMERKGIPLAEKLLDKLMLSAMIEARSCERFRLLSTELEDEELRAFYHKFMVSEAGHYRLFLDLANLYFPEDEVKTRWQEWVDMETELMHQWELRGDRMH